MSPAMDSEARWVEVFRETLPALYGFVSRRAGGDRALAEDVTQETWLRALRDWREQGIPREPLAWLQTVARRLMLTQFRAEQRRPSADSDVGLAGASSPGAAPDWTSEDVAALREGLDRLAPAEARLLEAFHIEGASTRQLAERFRTSERAIEGRLHRARARLRQILERSLQ